MYEDRGIIKVRNAVTAEVVNEIFISESDNIYIAYHYSQDLIFYIKSDSFGRLYRIYLVNEDGDRIISGNGDLLTDKNSNHMETLINDQLNDILGLHVDEENNKLYVLTFQEIAQLDLEGKNKQIIYKEDKSVLSRLFYHGGMLYFSAGSYESNPGVFRIDINTKKTETLVNLQPNTGGTIDLAVDQANNKLFIRQGNQIIVIDTNSSSSAYPVPNPRIVLSDSQFTGGDNLQAIVADSRILVWLSREQLYEGIVNANFKFIPKKSIFKYGLKSDMLRPYNMRMFHHTFNTTNSPPPEANIV